MPLRLVLADDHYLVREGMRRLLETQPDVEVVAETKTNAIAAPMAGGPFVAAPGQINMTEAEPRAKDESWNERRPKPGA